MNEVSSWAMIQGFRDFVLRGNVVDLAVGVVMGAAFGGVVTAFTQAFLDPLVRLIGGGRIAGTIVLRPPDVGLGIAPLVLDYGRFLTALITFFLTALVIYLFVVNPMNRVTERFKREERSPVAEPSNEEKLLAEIRDELRRRPIDRPGIAD